MSLTVTDAMLHKEQQMPKPITSYPSQMVPMLNPYNPFQTTYSVPMNNIPIIKKYNISLSGADNNIQSVAEIFEDILPATHVAINKSTTLSERLILYSYIRSILVTKGDGQEIALTDKKNPEIINLLSYMKMLEINPYHFSRLTNNHYRTMADNFVMFKSCYPIRLDKSVNVIKCAKDSVNTNVRIYSLLNYDYLAYKIDKDKIKRKYSDIWREIFFYQYIREQILKKKMCPHFPLLFSYYITKNTGLDFDKIKQLKNKYVDKNEHIISNNEEIKKNFFNETIQSMLSIKPNGVIDLSFNNLEYQKKIEKEKKEQDYFNKHNKIFFQDNKKTVIIDDKFEIDLSARSNICIVALTESPNQNIMNWSTRTYIIDDGPVRKQLSTGVHSILEWEIIIFQLLVSMYVMEQKEIVINEFSWKKNIFIKDLEKDNVGYWKYNISGLEYYIQNLGNLLIIDSSFDDIQDGLNYSLLEEKELKYKLYGTFYGDEELKIMNLNIKSIKLEELMIENFKNIFSSNNFGTEFTNYGGIKPPEEIIKLLDNIGNENYKKKNNKEIELEEIDEIKEMSYQDIILKYFNKFLHNKIGKIVSEIESKQLFKLGKRHDFNKGELVAIKSHNFDSLHWGIFIEKLNNGSCNIFSCDIDFNKRDYYNYNISEISKIYGKIEQDYEPNDNINEEELLETYIL
jgi:hypothetical protein